MVFKCLDGSFRCIYAMVVGFNYLHGYVFAETELFDCRGRLVIRYVESWCVSICSQCVDYHAEGGHDVLAFTGFNGDGKNVVCVVIVGDKDKLLAVQSSYCGLPVQSV